MYLRPLKAADLEPWSLYLNLPEVYQHTSWNHPSSQELSSYLGNEIDNDPSARLRLAIADREHDHIVGTVGFHTVSEQNRSAEIAFDLHPTMWHKGVATAIAALVVDWAHNEAGMVRVQATGYSTAVERLLDQSSGTSGFRTGRSSSLVSHGPRSARQLLHVRARFGSAR